MSSISVNPPKTPVTTGSNGIAAATVPNVCKMPGPPAPFVPTPLPNIAKSSNSPKDFSKNVTFDGCKVAIKGATFTSIGDIASKATGGGIVSANVEGPARFVGPGSMDVKVEGKNVHLLSDPMLNNCGPSGSPRTPRRCSASCNPRPRGAGGRRALRPVPQDPRRQGAARRDRRHQGRREHISGRSQNRTSEKKKVPGVMLGVVRCPDGQVYAANSSRQNPDLQAELPGGWHAPSAGQWLNFRQLIPSEKLRKFDRAWRRMAHRNVEWNARLANERWEGGAGEPYYPPVHAPPSRPWCSHCCMAPGPSVSPSDGPRPIRTPRSSSTSAPA
ncbi:PAAR-like domain-containing protein [Nannocystis pusilla]|uniref:PAAR-like domain-containing protein n=1 Tax=Nannocystis pusilla TaxID=889268 RepID=UPI003B8189E0